MCRLKSVVSTILSLNGFESDSLFDFMLCFQYRAGAMPSHRPIIGRMLGNGLRRIGLGTGLRPTKACYITGQSM